MNTSERTSAKSELLRRKTRIEAVQRGGRDEGEWLEAQTEADPLDASASRRDAEMSSVIGDAEARELRRIDAALRRIEAGTWGVCVDCGEPIEPARRRAVPEAAFCRSCERAKEEARVAVW